CAVDGRSAPGGAARGSRAGAARPTHSNCRGDAMKPKRRSATVLVCVLACLVVVTGITAAMIKSALSARKAVRQGRACALATVLLESCMGRGGAQLAGYADYQGERCQLRDDVLRGSDAARVDITVSETSEPRSVEVIAQYPADSPLGVRRTYTFT